MKAENVIRIAIAGVSGRMGQQLLEMSHAFPTLNLTAMFSRKYCEQQNSEKNNDLLREHAGIVVSHDLEQHINDFDILIDFTRPETTLHHLAICQRHHKAMVIGTTGFDEKGKQAIAQASKIIPIVFSANFSVGITLMLKLLEQASKVLANDTCDIEVIEAHHRNKVDAPSGTALMLGDAVAKTLGCTLEQCAIYAREGYTGERQAGTIGFSTIRAGDIVGEHTVMFADIGERLEITHKATSRANFARGAMRAAIWLDKQPAGLYTMRDVLGLDQ